MHEDILSRFYKAVIDLAKAISKAAMKASSVLSGIPFQEIAKYNRRKAYHYRLSERNRLHPKRKPKGRR